MLYEVITLRLVAFVNEEPPFFYFGNMGSGVYAKAARARGDDIRVMLSLEMLGCYSDQPGSQRYPPFVITSYSIHYTKLYDPPPSRPFARPAA